MKINQSVEIELGPEEIAQEFLNLGSDKQAVFFNKLYELGGEWLSRQLQYISECPDLTSDGDAAMRLIGEYSSACLAPTPEVIPGTLESLNSLGI